jgi:hypothetical protein
MSDALLVKSDDFTDVEVDVLDYWLRAFDAGLDRDLVVGVLRAGLRLEHYKSLLAIPPTAEESQQVTVLRVAFLQVKDAVDAALAALDAAKGAADPEGHGGQSGASPATGYGS